MQKSDPQDLTADTRDSGEDGELLLGPLNELLGFHLAQAVVSTTAMFERHIGKPLDLSKVEYSMLMLILSNGPLNPKRLARALTLTPPKMTMLLDRMQERGLLLRERSEVDRRSQNVLLTEAGQRIAKSGASAARQSEQALNERLSRAEHAMLIELLRKASGR